jgi:hypothetical protein
MQLLEKTDKSFEEYLGGSNSGVCNQMELQLTAKEAPCTRFQDSRFPKKAVGMQVNDTLDCIFSF